jgi:SAM-dependent methyltransferase
MRSRRAEALRQRWFGNRLNDWQSYHAMVARHLRPGMTVLEIGPGKGTIAPFPWNEHPGIRLVGLDPDPQAAANPFLARFAHLTDERAWPIGDGEVDLVIARYVLEHVADPASFMTNLVRVLRPGGAFVFLTPNAASPVMWASRILPHRLHVRILGVTRGADPSDVFPTRYRANTRGAITMLARRHGLDVQALAASEFVPFGYLDFTLPGFLAASAYHQILTRTGLERWVGVSLTGILLKPEARRG